MEHCKGILPNGIRVIHIPTRSTVSHCGIMINAGTRDELATESGIAHLTEHMMFKGTRHRKAFHILSRLDDVGGDMDAFTTKEDITLYAGFLNTYYERSIELLADVVFNSVYPEKELIKEREVICDEINSYRDNPAELIFDEFEAMLYNHHPLGNPILGSRKSVKNISVDKINDFVQRCFCTDQMVFCSVGNIDFKKLMQLCTRYMGHFPVNTRAYQRQLFGGNGSFNTVKKIKSHQSHCIIGNTAYSYRDPKRLPLLVLSNILAGPGMNSRLNLLLREKHGITYNIEAVYNPYFETGNFSVYFGTDQANVDKSLTLIRKEILGLCNHRLGSLQLSKARKQIIGQMAMGAENHSSLMLSIGKSYLVFDEVESFETLCNRIEAVTASDILEVANEICYPDKLSMLLFN